MRPIIEIAIGVEIEKFRERLDGDLDPDFERPDRCCRAKA